MAGGSRPKRALTDSTTCPGGTTNALCAAAGGGGAAGGGATGGVTTVGVPGVTRVAGGGAGKAIGAGGRGGGGDAGSADCAWVGSASSPEIISGAANQQRQPAVPFPRPPMCRFMAVILAFSSRLPGLSGRLRYATRSARRADRTPTSFSSSRLQAGKAQ